MIVLVIGGALLYARRGAFAGVTTFFMTLIASLAAINYYGLVEMGLTWLSGSVANYADAVGMLFVFALVFLILQYAAVTFLEEHIELNMLVNGLVGGLFGGLACLLLAGLLSIAWLMLPGSAYFLGGDGKTEASVSLNADEAFLTTARFVANERIGGASLFDPAHTFMRNNTNKYAKSRVKMLSPNSGTEIQRLDPAEPKIRVNPDAILNRGEIPND